MEKFEYFHTMVIQHNNKINESIGRYKQCKKSYVKIVDNFSLTLVCS